MRKYIIFFVCLIAVFLLASCRGKEEPAANGNEGSAYKGEKFKGTKVDLTDVVDFYYTYEWIGYNAEYLRYRFYTEDGRHYFFHEARKVEEDYGPAGKDDVTSIGTAELSQEEWDKFLGLIKDGKISKPEESASTGDKGPWLYIYYTKGNDTQRMAYTFDPYISVEDFEEYCESLANR